MKLTHNDLLIIIQEGEGQKVEFKEMFTPAIAQDLAAFANASGGTIYIGIDDENGIKGLELTNTLRSQIMDLARNCDPAIHIHIQFLDGVAIVNVDEGVNKPYQCKNGFFLRQGPNTQKLSRDQIIQFYIDETKIRFDIQFNPKFKFPVDFDMQSFNQYLETIKFSGNYKTEDILINMGVARKYNNIIQFTNAGILFFAKEPCKFFPSAYVDAAVFKGTKRVDVIDRKTFNRGLFENLNKIRIYLQEHLNARYEYREDWRRENIYELPLDALREAAANALMHRDYFITGANIMISILDDRVEITSPGGLPEPLLIKDLGKVSKRRNELIADLFSRLVFIEKLGTGINKIKNWMKDCGLKPPVIQANGFFIMTFKRPDVPKMSLKNVPEMSLKNVSKRTRYEYILNKIRSKEPFTSITISKELNVTDKTIKRDMQDLKNSKHIKFTGSRRSGYYEIIN